MNTYVQLQLAEKNDSLSLKKQKSVYGDCNTINFVTDKDSHKYKNIYK